MKARVNGHYFRKKWFDADGTEHVSKGKPAKVIRDKGPLYIPLGSFLLEPANVRRSMELGGVGSTTTCSIACGMTAHRTSLKHPFVGEVDVSYNRMWVGSKRSKKTGDVSECHVYAHRCAKLAILNDTPGGQKKLLEILEKDGPMEVELYPVPASVPYAKRTPPHKGNYDGSKRAFGAKLRYRVALAGGVEK